MGLFQRLFSTEYRKAVAAEAAGDFLTAARCYALCGETQKVSDMHLAQARREGSLEGRIRSLRNALDFAEQDRDAGRRQLVQRLLGEALRRLGQRHGPQTNEGRQVTLEAGEAFASSKSYETAGEVFLEAGDVDRAVDAFSKAGLVERVESLLSEQDREQSRQRELDASFKDYELYLSGGQRDEALEALQRCVDAAERKGSYRRLRDELEARMLRAGRCCLQLNAGGRQTRLEIVCSETLVLGREPACELVVRGPSVSRQHTRLLLGDGALWLEDAGSRNGTLLGGLPVGARMQLPLQAEIGLGESASLSIEQLALDAQRGPTAKLRVQRGMDRDKLLLWMTSPEATSLASFDADLPPLLVAFRRGRPWLSAAQGLSLSLNGQRVVDAIQAIVDDELDLGGERVRVGA